MTAPAREGKRLAELLAAGVRRDLPRVRDPELPFAEAAAGREGVRIEPLKVVVGAAGSAAADHAAAVGAKAALALAAALSHASHAARPAAQA